MNINEEIMAFRKIARDLLEIEITDEASPGLFASRALFSSAVHALKRGDSLIKGEILLLAKEFLSILDERHVEITDKDRNYFLGKNIKSKKEIGWITQDVMKGAYGHEKSQPSDAM